MTTLSHVLIYLGWFITLEIKYLKKNIFKPSLLTGYSIRVKFVQHTIQQASKMFKRVEKFFSGVVSGTSAESSSAPASDSAFGAGVPSEPAKQVRSYLFDQAEGLAGGAASMRLVGFCESPVAGKYFVADGRSVSGSSCF